MERRQRIVEVTVNEVIFPTEEMETVEAVVAAYHNGHTADNLAMFNTAGPDDEFFAFDERYLGSIIISGLKQASAGRPARFDIFDLSDDQRQQATQMLEGLDQSEMKDQRAQL